MKTIPYAATAIVCLSFSTSAFAQDYLKEQCTQLVARADANPNLAPIQNYRKLIDSNKEAVTTAVTNEQEELEKATIEVFKQIPEIQKFAAEKNAMTAEQKQAGLSVLLTKILNTDAINKQLADAATTMNTKSTAESKNATAQSIDAPTPNFHMTKTVTANGLSLRMQSNAYLRNVDDTLVLLISTTAATNDAPRVAEMTRGMRIYNLESGQDVAEVAQIPNWNGETRRVILVEPFSSWQLTVADAMKREESQEVTACRTLVK